MLAQNEVALLQESTDGTIIVPNQAHLRDGRRVFNAKAAQDGQEVLLQLLLIGFMTISQLVWQNGDVNSEVWRCQMGIVVFAHHSRDVAILKQNAPGQHDENPQTVGQTKPLSDLPELHLTWEDVPKASLLHLKGRKVVDTVGGVLQDVFSTFLS